MTVVATPQRLWCAAGEHVWERPPARGRKPTSCPEHLARRDHRARPQPTLPMPQRQANAGQRRLDRTAPEQRSEHEKRTHPLDPLYLAVGEASLAVNTPRRGGISKALGRVAFVAELLALDPAVTGETP
jgi:hypothetical protein